MRFTYGGRTDDGWSRWFAWHPIELCNEDEWGTGNYVWLEYIERKLCIDPYSHRYVYRLCPEEPKP